MTKTVPMKVISSSEVPGHFMTSWVFKFGRTEELIANNVGCFKSMFFIDVCRVMSIQYNFTTTYHPQINGQVDLYNVQFWKC